MVVQHLPSPNTAQQYRLGKSWPLLDQENKMAQDFAAPIPELKALKESARLCSDHPSASVLVFIAKMVDGGEFRLESRMAGGGEVW